MQTEQHIIGEWVHVVMCLNHRRVPVSLLEDKKCICMHNKSQTTVINTVTGVQAEQSRNFDKMVISQQFLNLCKCGIVQILGIMVMNQNESHEAINSKLNLGNACQLSDQNFFFSHLLHENINVNIYNLLIVLY